MKIKEIKLKCDIAWQEKFLELTGHKVGDKVKCSFHFSIGNEKRAFSSIVDGDGIIERTEKGILVKSCEKYRVAHSDYRDRRFNRGPYWRFEKEYVYMNLDNIKE